MPKFEINNTVNVTHGMSHTPEHNTWHRIKTRCLDKNSPHYKSYGAKGIGICDRWKDSFENFFKDMGIRPPEAHSIDRIDNSKGYSPDNCRWATATEQARNRSNNRIVEYNGESKTVVEWAEQLGISYSALRQRIRLGWSVQRAFTQKVRGH